MLYDMLSMLPLEEKLWVENRGWWAKLSSLKLKQKGILSLLVK